MNKKVIAITVVVSLILVALVIRHINLSKKGSTDENTTLSQDTITSEVETESTIGETKITSFVDKKDETTTRKEIEDITTKEEETTTKKSIDIYFNVTGNTEVPKLNVDGSSYLSYRNSIDIDDFKLVSPSQLTDENLYCDDYYVVGTEQTVTGDLKSLGWLRTNLDSLDKNKPVHFTNLHVIDNLNSKGVSLLCSYDWYSAFGLKDTLVLLNNISDTSGASKYKSGDIVSVVIFIKNISIQYVNNQWVVCLNYISK